VEVLHGLTLENAERKFNMTIVMHQSDGELHLHPTSDDVVKENDTLVVFATLETLGHIGGLNQRAEHPQPSKPVKRRRGRKHVQ
jgi:Trk K+ transport system NAD-binding subunit